MVNYQNGKIYRLDCLTTGDVYIGSTTANSLAIRLTQHVYSCKHWKKSNKTKKYITSFLIIDRGNYKISLIELFPCNSRDELHTREGHFIRTMDCINKCIAGRKKLEYYQDNKEHLAEYYKQYNETHKEQLEEYRKHYNEIHKDKITEYQKKYRETHKEQRAEYDRKRPERAVLNI